ncbi:hypothetical protein EZL74_03935 [Flavobacterium silvisoli]|uniref:Uncharacterized protein n=1 Tax=Flavobacterium silvisoli TaxID=2529433 RepID=A0A4Q9Z1V1_9FLAO|nr:hypothetical protein [Flavobacterium silvisoli]TBX70334.1 hypothetical protein EZL74_03935 [Flavobacterium silvisoli]
MIKPTIALNFSIIEHVVNDIKIADLLNSRDQNPLTFGMETRCRIIPEKSSHSNLIYILEFTYKAPDNLNHLDDVAVLVEVTEGPVIQILEFKIT